MGEPVVLTSENSASFYAHKLGIVPEPPEDSDIGTAAVESANDATPAPAGKAAQQEPPETKQDEGKQKLNLRFSELTKQRDEQKAKADAETERANLAERRAAEAEAKLTPPQPQVLGEPPKKEQFSNDDEFIQASVDYEIDKRDFERKAQETVDAYVKRQNAFKAENPDFEVALAKAADLQVSNDVRDAIIESEVGPRILLHLAQNPEFVVKLAHLPIKTQMREIGKLEAKLEALPAKADAPQAPPVKPAAAAQEISRAPAPITPLKGSDTTPDVKVDSNGEFYGTAAEYRAARKAGKIK